MELPEFNFEVRHFDGSCMYACQFGDLYAITTTVQPSRVNRSPSASLWISRDAKNWKRASGAQQPDIQGFAFNIGLLNTYICRPRLAQDNFHCQALAFEFFEVGRHYIQYTAAPR